MKAEEFEALIPDYILGKLSTSQNEAFSKYLDKNPNALEEWTTLNEDLQYTFESSSNMDDTFYSFLNTEKNREDDTKIVQLETSPKGSIFKRLLPLVAASALLLFGFFIGYRESDFSLV